MVLEVKSSSDSFNLQPFKLLCSSLHPLLSVLCCLSSSVVSLTRRRHWSFGVALRQLVVLAMVVVVTPHCQGLILLGFILRGLGNVISSHCVLISLHSRTASAEWMYKCLVDGFLTLISRQGCLLNSSHVYTELIGIFKGENCVISIQRYRLIMVLIYHHIRYWLKK